MSTDCESSHRGASDRGLADRGHVVGALCAGSGAAAYGVTIVIGRDLASQGFDSATVLGIRFGLAGVILIGVLVAARRPLLPVPGERLSALLLGVVGYAIESTFFYLGLVHGTAAAVALLFYFYPAIVAVFEIVLTRVRPPASTWFALALSATGTVLVAASGNRVEISSTGVAFTIASAVAFSAYLLTGERLMRRTDSMTTGAWVALGASISLLTRAQIIHGIHVRSGHWPELLTYGAATAVAFTLMFAALRRIGSSRTAVVMTLEAVCAIVLSAIFLDERIGAVQAIGGVAILAAAVIIGLHPPAFTPDAVAEAP
jgi:drug/metabolite transporter (DMT)-like permease